MTAIVTTMTCDVILNTMGSHGDNNDLWCNVEYYYLEATVLDTFIHFI